jgi:hypothetical protein
LIDWASVGVDPAYMGMGPAPATRAVLKRTGLTLDDLDLIEVNEAFAAQYLAVEKELGLDRDRVNVNGGAIALGHPLGATGTRLLLTLVLELKRRGSRRASAAVKASPQSSKRFEARGLSMAIKTVGVLGCGLMGAGIAQVSAAAGYRTIVREVDQAFLDKGLTRIRKFLDEGVVRGSARRHPQQPVGNHRHEGARQL